MGHGATDFTALEKLKLGWISNVRRVAGSGSYTVADIDAPSTAPQALVVPTAAGEYWIEHRATAPRRGRRPGRQAERRAAPVYLRSVFLARARRATQRRVSSA